MLAEVALTSSFLQLPSASHSRAPSEIRPQQGVSPVAQAAVPSVQCKRCLPCWPCSAPTTGAACSPCPPMSSVPVPLGCPRSGQRNPGSCTGLLLNRSWCTDMGVLGPEITLDVAWNRGESRALSRLNTPAHRHSQCSAHS